MFLRCDNPDCSYETGDCPDRVKQCLIWVKMKVLKDGGKCLIDDDGVTEFECPKCKSKEFSVD